MGKFIDLTGKRFGKLVVVSRADNTARGACRWRCLCDCGNVRTVQATNLTGGNSSSCGCSQIGLRVVDLTGKRFGRLRVVRRADTNGLQGQVRWLCRCRCGNEHIVNAGNLTSGAVKGCGCRRYGEPGQAGLTALYSTYKHGAKVRGYVFRLSKATFKRLSQENCHWCGCQPRATKSAGRSKESQRHSAYTHSGIDRVDSSKGYFKGNVVACCKACNTAKLAMPRDEFLAWVERVYKHSIAT